MGIHIGIHIRLPKWAGSAPLDGIGRVVDRASGWQGNCWELGG